MARTVTNSEYRSIRKLITRFQSMAKLNQALGSRRVNPRRVSLCAAHQTPRSRAGGATAPPRHHAGDDGGVVAVDLLQQTAAADRKVVVHLRRMQMQSVVVD